MHANGIGVGSFVYLRRIFEALIFEAGEKLITQGAITKEDFYTKRMDEKIEVAKSELPDFLVKNKSIYGILSKGVHELLEEECLKYFEVIKNGIELILDDKIEKEEKENRRKTLSASIASIAGEIKN